MCYCGKIYDTNYNALKHVKFLNCSNQCNFKINETYSAIDYLNFSNGIADPAFEIKLRLLPQEIDKAIAWIDCLRDDLLRNKNLLNRKPELFNMTHTTVKGL